MPPPDPAPALPSRFASFLCSFLLAGLCLSATLAAAAEAGIRRLEGLEYSSAEALPQAAHKVDLAYSEHEVRPLVVFVHGGGWQRGSRRTGRQLEATLLGAGFAVASVDYRLWPAASVREAAADVATAIRYLQDNAGPYNLAPCCAALIGHSAGAHIAALVLTLDDLPQATGLDRNCIDAAVLLDGHGFELDVYTANRPALARIFGDDRAERDAVSPVALLASDPPEDLPEIALAWGSDRPKVNGQSMALIAALTDAGARVTALPFPGKSHGAFLTDFADPESDLSRAVVGFLHRTID